MKTEEQEIMKKRIISSVLIGLILLGAFFLNKISSYLVLVIISALGIQEIWSVNIGKHKTNRGFFIFVFFPALYIVSALIWVVGKLRWETNICWLISAILATSAYDILAYFIGKSVGRHKIAPRISPNKTWEGTMAGFLGPILVITIMGKYFLHLNFTQVETFALMIGFLSFFGDLSVSWYKRKLGMKDIGFIIPGHGGLLDRIDSHLLVFIGVFLFQAII